jgi:hypothetical protein
MNYELAKQLRDTGFPQSGSGKWIGPPEKIVWRSGDRATDLILCGLFKLNGQHLHGREKKMDEAQPPPKQ